MFHHSTIVPGVVTHQVTAVNRADYSHFMAGGSREFRQVHQTCQIGPTLDPLLLLCLLSLCHGFAFGLLATTFRFCSGLVGAIAKDAVPAADELLGCAGVDGVASHD